MSKTKKTMYEVLEVSPDASDSELQAAHQRLTQQLQSEKNDVNREETEFKLRVVNVAFNTLSVKRTRDAYDARLAALNAPAGAAPSLSLIPAGSKVETSSLKAEAMSLKAEAMSLKAEAVSLRADVMALKGDTGFETPAVSGLTKFFRMMGHVRGALAIVGSLIAMGMVFLVVSLLMAHRQAVKTEEKVLLQDYYQRTGVRVGSRAELEGIELINRREEAEKQREELAKRVQQEQEQAKEREYDRFVDDSRRFGDEVSANLRREEERARYEEEQRNRELAEQQEQEKRYQEEMERQRVEAEMDRYRRINEDFRNNAAN